MRIRVKVTTSARRELFKKAGDAVFEVSVKEKAERGEANARVRQLVARYFDVPLSRVRFITGTRSPSKMIEVVR